MRTAEYRRLVSQVAIGALENDSQLRLTPLGFHLAHMPVDARIGGLAALCQGQVKLQIQKLIDSHDAVRNGGL